MLERLRRRVYEILESAAEGDLASRAFDIALVALIALNALAVVLVTVDVRARLSRQARGTDAGAFRHGPVAARRLEPDAYLRARRAAPGLLEHSRQHVVGYQQLTLVGYGDVVPVTLAGRLVGALVQVLSIAFVALPTSILGSSFEMRAEGARCTRCGKILDEA